MLQPKYAKQLDSNIKELVANGGSNEDIDKMASDYTSLFSDEALKKKGESTATAPPQKLVSETPTGSSVGVKPNAVAKAPIKVVENATQKEQRLRKELSNVKVTSANMDAVSAKTDELSALQKSNSKAAKQKLDATDNNIISKIFSTNKQGLDAAFKSEEDDNEVSDYLREGGKKLLNVVGGIVNTVPRGINKFSSNSGFPLNIPTADKFEPKIPFGTQLNEVDAETAERKKQDPNYFVNEVDRMALAKEKFGAQAVKQQHLENAAELLNDQDPEVQIRIKSKIINSIKGTTATSKAISAQIQALDKQATPLSNEISEMEKTIKGGKYTEQFAKDYETKKASFNAISEQYKGLLDDASKNDNENLTAQERLEVFKLDYNPFVKAADDIVGGFSKLGGDALYAMGKLSQKINEIPGVANINEKLSIGGAGTEDPSNIFLQGAEVLLKDAENRQNAHPHIKVTDIKGFGDLGGWAGQTLGAIAPFAIGMAIGSTEASLASKAFLPMSPGLMGFSLGAAGGAMSDMDKEMANTPGLDYSNWQYMAKTAGSVGSNALMFGNYAAIFKGNKALFESIGKTPAATVEFKKGFQDYAGDLFKVAKDSNKTGATMALVSGINMFVDNHILGKKHEGSFEEIADSYVEGVAMHIGTAEAPKALVFMAEKLLPSPTKKAIRSNLGTIHTLMKEINNPNLTPQERAIVTKKVFETHKENTVLLSKSLKDAGKLTGPQVNELLIADQNRFDITKKVEEVKKGNFSDEYKKSELNKLKAEFKALDSRTTNVFSDPFNAINILPDAVKRKTEAQRELIKEFNDKNPESNKKIVLEDNEINERALKNYSKELKDDKAAKLEVEKEQAPIVETPVAETPKAKPNTEEVDLELEHTDNFYKENLNSENDFAKKRAEEYFKDKEKFTQKDIDFYNEKLLENPNDEFAKTMVQRGEQLLKELEAQKKAQPKAKTPKAEEVVTPEVQKSNEIIVPNLGDKIEIINESTPQGNTPTNPQVEGVSKVVEENKKADSPYDAINKEEALYREKQQKDKDKAINDIELIKSGDESTIDTYFKKSGYKEITSNEQDTRLKGKEGKFFRSTGASIIIKNSKLDVALDTAINVSNKKIKGLSNSRIEEIAKNFESEKSSKGNPPTNGDVQPGVQPVGESGVAKPETPAKEGVPSPVDGGKSKGDVEVSDLDHAKDQIEKGVLQWNGDTGAERVKLGISWADIRKGEADIKRGKENTVPAKRLIEALKTAKEKGGYEYTQGKGGITNEQFVSLEDIQRSSNENNLTDAEQKEVDANEVKLAKEHEDYFNSLDEKTQNDILENYENREQKDNSGEVQGDSPIRESKNDVPNQEKGEGAKPTTKERVAERVKLSDSKIDAKSEIVKAKLKAFTDMFPSADINPADYKQNGFSMDAVIDMVAKAAKSIAKGGIVTSEHINEAIKAWNEHFDDVIDVKEIEKITNPKEEPLFVDENGDSYTSLKNAVSNPEREAKGKEVVVVRDGKTDAERKQDLHDRMDSGEISKEEIQDLTTALANGSVEELATRHSKADIITILLKDKVSLENRTTEIRQELEANKGTEKEGQSLLDLARNEMLEDQNYLASATLKGEWSEMGRNLQDAMKADFSRPAIIKKLENASKNNELSPELRKKAGEMAEEIKQMQTKLDEHQAKYEELDAKYKDKETENADLQEKISKHEGEKALEKAVKLQGLKTKKEYKIADIEKKQKVVIDRLREKYKNLSGMVNVGINPKFLELAPDIAILAKYEIQKGAVKLEEVIGRVHLQLVDIIPELTERDVRDLFSGYGKSVIPKEVSANEQTLRDLRAKARALSGLQDVKEEGTAPLRSGFRHTEPTPEVLALRKEIHREMRARGIDMKNAKDPQAVWKTAIESYKTRTNNRIEYLESIAKSKDLEKYLREKKKTKMKLDDEARQLRVKSQKLKHVVDDMVSKADFEAWSKFRKTRHYGVRYTRGVLISAPTTLAKILGAAAWRTAYKIPTAVATYGASKLRPGIAKVEGINTVKDLTQHIVDYYKTEFSMTNLKESFKTLKNHASQEEILFGKHHGRIPLPKVIGNKSLNTAQKLFFGHLKFLEDISASSHGALKNLVALPEYEAYKNTIMRNLIREGIPEDMMNDGSMEQIAHQLAYAKSQRARFGQDNAVSSAKSEWMAKLKNKKHYMTADVIDIALPIVKIASNYIGESLEKYPVIGLAGNRKSLLKASDMLTSKEQGHLLRTLASQGVGAMSLVAGAMMYKNISAFYGTDADDQAKEQNPELAKHDGAIGAISHLLAHSPDAEMIRVGASFMWYWELYDKKNNADKSIMSDFMLATIKNTTSIMNQSPYFSTSESLVAPLLDSDFSFESLGKVGVNFIRPRVPLMDATNVVAQGKIPQLEKLAPELSGKISKKLGMTPETVKPYEVGLRPKGFVDNLKMGIPGWRNELLKKLMEESKMPKLKTPEAFKDRKENKFKKIKNEVQFRKEHK